MTIDHASAFDDAAAAARADAQALTGRVPDLLPESDEAPTFAPRVYIDNPYKTEFEQTLREHGIQSGDKRGSSLVMSPCLRKYGFVLPSEDAIRAIAAHGPIVEIGAGLGYWKWQLEQLGVKVEAFDIAPQRGSWSHVTILEPDERDGRAAGLYPDHALLLCYPERFKTTMSSDALKHYLASGGNTVIYVGDPSDPQNTFTGDSKFHAMLDDLRQSGWQITTRIDLKTWPYFPASLFIYTRKTPTFVE